MCRMLTEWRNSQASPVCVGVRAGMQMVDSKPNAGVGDRAHCVCDFVWQGLSTASRLEPEVGHLFRNRSGSVFWGETVGFGAW